MNPPAASARSRWPTILLVVGAGVVSAFQVGKAPLALAAIQADLAASLATASWLLSAFAIVGAATGIVVGVAVDRAGARRMLLGGLVVQGFCCVVGASADGISVLLATRAIEGIGFITVTVAAPALIDAVSPPRVLGRAIAVWGTFMPVGFGLVMLGAPLLTAIGWRGFWLINAAILIGYAGLLALTTIRSIPSEGERNHGIMDNVVKTLTARGPWLLAALMAAFSAAFFAVFGFLPSILSDQLRVAIETAGLMTAAAVAVNAIGNLACGPLMAAGVRRDYILSVGFATMALCGFGILGGGLPGPVAYALCLVFSVVSGLVPVALIEGASRYAPRPNLVGATVGFVMQGNNIGLVLGPAGAGALAGAFGWHAVSLLVGALGLAAILLTAALRPRRKSLEPGG
ncbi:MAG TPA: MFS transporter [Alphaproteobacteria bacterium]|nr:MFS transporter [Alphaproteobacteria bacterium]